jgi:hypothetical protein
VAQPVAPTPWHQTEPGRSLAGWALPLGIGRVLTHPHWTRRTKTVVVGGILLAFALAVVVYVATGQSPDT